MGRRHAGSADQRLQGRPVARCQWQPAGQLRKADRADPPAKLRDTRSPDDDRGSDFLHGAVDGNAQTATGTAQRTAGLLLPREREVPGAHAEDKEISGSRIPAAPMSTPAIKDPQLHAPAVADVDNLGILLTGPVRLFRSADLESRTGGSAEAPRTNQVTVSPSLGLASAFTP